MTNFAESEADTNDCFRIGYFPGATFQIYRYDENQAKYQPGNWIIEYADPGKNISVGRDGVDNIPITDDLIGIYNVVDGKYDMLFDKFVKPE